MRFGPCQLHAGADSVMAALARKSRLAAAGCVVEVEPLELILLRRGDRDIGIGRTAGGGEHLLVDRLHRSVERPVAPSFVPELRGIACVEPDPPFARQTVTAVAP